uniref:Putative secreted protein n=1 Tax=Ixodes ricinus TaxID=34613 RepID=A0A6B0UR76_IXORI
MRAALGVGGLFLFFRLGWTSLLESLLSVLPPLPALSLRGPVVESPLVLLCWESDPAAVLVLATAPSSCAPPSAACASGVHSDSTSCSAGAEPRVFETCSNIAGDAWSGQLLSTNRLVLLRGSDPRKRCSSQ